MTTEELYRTYMDWTQGVGTISKAELFRWAYADQNVFEDECRVVNRLFYLIPDFSQGRLHSFVFFEENEFDKDEAGDLHLIRSVYHLGRGK